MLVEVIRSPVVHWHDQAPELDLRSTIFLGSIPLLELNQIVADALPFGLLDFDGNPGVGVVEVDTVIKSQVRPELTVWVVAASSVPFVFVLGMPLAIVASNPRLPCVSPIHRIHLMGRHRPLIESMQVLRPETPRTRSDCGARLIG